MASVVDDQEIMWPIMLANKVHDGAVELELRFGSIGKLNDFSSIFEIFPEEFVQHFDLFTCKRALRQTTLS